MIDKEIKNYILSINSELDFKGLASFLEASDADFKNTKLKLGSAFSTFYGVHVDLRYLNRYNSESIYFLFLHELAHHKRMKKYGIEKYYKIFGDSNFETFFDELIKEEMTADRYATFLFRHFNKINFPYYLTQQLDKPDKRNSYEQIGRFMHGKITDEETYNKFLELVIE